MSSYLLKRKERERYLTQSYDTYHTHVQPENSNAGKGPQRSLREFLLLKDYGKI